MANMTAHFLVSDKKEGNDFKNITYPLFHDGHIQSIFACIYQDI